MVNETVVDEIIFCTAGSRRSKISFSYVIVLVFLKSVGVFGFKKNTNVYKVKYYVLVSLVTNVHTHAFVFLFFYKVNIGMFYICWPAS